MAETAQHTGVPSRVRFFLGQRTADLAVPSDVPLADVLTAVLPQLTGHPGAPRPEDWLLHRLGAAALDQERTPAMLRLLDGESLYLSPKSASLEPFGSAAGVLDGAAVAAGPRPWTPAASRLALHVSGTTTMLAAFGLALFAIRPEGLQAVAAAVGAVALIVTAAFVSWSGGDRRTALLLSGGAMANAAAAGWFSVVAAHPVADPATYWSAGAAAAAIATCAGLVCVPHSGPLFTGVLAGVVLLAVPALLVALRLSTPGHAAAVGLSLTLVAALFVPGTAFRLSGLTLPLLPTNAEELGEDIEPFEHAVVTARGTATLRYLKGLHVGLGVAQCALLTVLWADDGAFTLWFAIVLAALLFLRARHLSGMVQRWAVLVPAALAAGSAGFHAVAGQAPIGRLLGLGLPALAAGLILLVLSRALPGRRLKPYWLRAVDLLESLTALCLFPLLLGVLNVYELMRELGS
jgi:type VII secretion integral membrane protein EccD